MTLKLRSASNEALRKVQSLSVMITSSLSPYSPDKWVALAKTVLVLPLQGSFFKDRCAPILD